MASTGISSPPVAARVPAWRDLGLRIRPHGGRSPIVAAFLIGLAFGIYMALADALVFRAVIPVAQASLVSGLSAFERIEYFAWRAVLDELIFRLVLMSALAWLLAVIAGRPWPWCFWSAIVACALVIYPLVHLSYLATLDPVPLTWVRELALHGMALVLWGWLYWRHGLAASIIGHVSAHFTLQPMLGLLFG